MIQLRPLQQLRLSSKQGEGWPEGYGLNRLDEVDSTNAEALRIAARTPGRVWVTANSQTKARGRRGRVWSTPLGALAASLLLHPREPADVAALRSFVAALALADAFEMLGVSRSVIGLKWPNDVLLYESKVAGILLESTGSGTRLDHLVIGVGVNLTGEPDVGALEPGARAPITLAQVLGRPVSAEDMLGALASAYAHWEDRFLTDGFAPIRLAWLDRAARLGEVITARTLRESHEGTFETVDETGNLVLNTPKGAVAIAAADVFF